MGVLLRRRPVGQPVSHSPTPIIAHPPSTPCRSLVGLVAPGRQAQLSSGRPVALVEVERVPPGRDMLAPCRPRSRPHHHPGARRCP